MKENLETWRCAPVSREMKVSCSKTEYMNVYEKEAGGRVKI